MVVPAVLVTIAWLSEITATGVVRLVSVPGGVNRSFKLDAEEGVPIEVENNSIRAALYIVVTAVADTRAVGV